jgi:predicted ribosome-associated RNA-binding protein Tma20
MKKSEQIIKSLVLPVLEKDNNFNQLNLNDDFWNTFTSGLLIFEIDAKNIFKTIYELQLNDPEKVIEKITSIHTKLIKELAEFHVLDVNDEAIDILLANNSKLFFEQVNYYKTVKSVITKLERKRIKDELPDAYKKVTFEIPENDLELVIKKTERENVKKKFKQWDEELETENSVHASTYSTENTLKQKNTKVIYLSWFKYAGVAAIFLIAFIIWQPTKQSNEKLFAEYTSDEQVVQSIDYKKIKVSSESAGYVRGGGILLENLNKLETDLAIEAIQLFKNNNFEKSKEILASLEPRDRNDQLVLFLAITQLKTNELEPAVSNLEYLSKSSNFEYQNEIKFYLALCYLKQNQKNKAKSLFNELIKNNDKYSKASQEIVSNIRWF